LRHLRAAPSGRPSIADEDRVSMLWIAVRLLNAAWHPTDAELDALGSLIEDTDAPSI
jgi:hypothetical protein